jgi:hypothetical protein
MADLNDAVTGFGRIACATAASTALPTTAGAISCGGSSRSWAGAGTVLALEHAGPAVYNIVDDEPAPVREWLPVLAQAMGAEPPRHFPAWLARLFAGEAAVAMGTESRGASNAKAKRELGWKLRYPPRPAARTHSHS